MQGLKVEAIFGGLLAVVVLGVALYSIANTSFGGTIGGGPGSNPGNNGVSPTSSTMTPTLTAATGQDLICQCYDEAFGLAGKVTVISPEYRTGFEQCRARGGVDGGDAWTAGWNARLSAKPYEASCRSYKRRQ